MGVNINLVKLGKDIHEFTDLKFDSMRHSGDKEYGRAELEWKYRCCSRPLCCDYIFKRPEDFTKHEKWIMENICSNNQKRLLDALKRMKKDSDVYFYFSY